MDRGAGSGHADGARRRPGARPAPRGGRRAPLATRGYLGRCTPGRTDASSSGRRTPTTRSSSSCCGAAAGAPLEAVLDPNTWAERRGAGLRRAVARRCPRRLRQGPRGDPWRGDPRARRRDWAAASRPAPRHEPRVAGLATRLVGLLLCGQPRAGRGAPGPRGALERHLRAPSRVGRAGPPDLRRRPCEGVLVLRHGQRVRPLRRALRVGLRARQRRRAAAPRRRHAPAGGASDAVHQPRPGHRRLAAHPDRPRCAARTVLRRVAVGPDRVADADPGRPRHPPDGDRHRRPPLCRLLGRGIASGAHPRRGRHLPARDGVARHRLGRSRRRCRRLQRRHRRLERRRGLGRLHVVGAAAVGLSLRLRRRPPHPVPRAGCRARRGRLRDRPGLVRVARRDARSRCSSSTARTCLAMGSGRCV